MEIDESGLQLLKNQVAIRAFLLSKALEVVIEATGSDELIILYEEALEAVCPTNSAHGNNKSLQQSS